MGALSGSGLKVQPFKTGPDYIDTTYHTWVTGSPSRNLDTWMLPHKIVQELFQRAMEGTDIGVVEGVMGLFDGHSSTSDEGSTAGTGQTPEVAGGLDRQRKKCSPKHAAAMVKGYLTFDASLNIAGVILNGLGSEGHFNICREAIEHYTGVQVLGYLPRRSDLVLPERHLGLIPTVEGPASEAFKEALINQCEASLDIDAIIKLSARATPPHAASVVFPPKSLKPGVRIAIARDKAFSFYYQDSLDLIQAWGAELIPFSPLSDTGLPDGIGGIYIGGGFPEMYAAELAGNEPMKRSIHSAAKRGLPIYGECGGLMYLGSTIRDFESKEHTMTGILPSVRRWTGRGLLWATGPSRPSRTDLCSRRERLSGATSSTGRIWNRLLAWIPRIQSSAVEGRVEGFQVGNVLASYVHLHLAALPSMAKRFVDVCRA